MLLFVLLFKDRANRCQTYNLKIQIIGDVRPGFGACDRPTSASGVRQNTSPNSPDPNSRSNWVYCGISTDLALGTHYDVVPRQYCGSTVTELNIVAKTVTAINIVSHISEQMDPT
jgi:hypothetical protein